MLGLIFAIPCALLRGFVVQKLWLWFLVPLGLPVLGLAHTIGICLIVSLMTFQFVVDPFDKLEDRGLQAVARAAGSIILSLYAWGVGALVVWFM